MTYDYTRACASVARQSLAFHSASLADTKLGGGHLAYFLCIYDNPGITQEGVAEKTRTDRSTVAKMLRQLVDDGFIVRRIAETDRRAYNLFVTKKGNAIHGQAIESVRKWNEHLTKNLTDAEKIVLGMLLDKLNL